MLYAPWYGNMAATVPWMPDVYVVVPYVLMSVPTTKIVTVQPNVEQIAKALKVVSQDIAYKGPAYRPDKTPGIRTMSSIAQVRPRGCCGGHRRQSVHSAEPEVHQAAVGGLFGWCGCARVPSQSVRQRGGAVWLFREVQKPHRGKSEGQSIRFDGRGGKFRAPRVDVLAIYSEASRFATGVSRTPAVLPKVHPLAHDLSDSS